MSQVGHADSKMTTDVYAQLQQRAKRGRGTKFDTLVRDASEQLRSRGRKAVNGQVIREWAIQDSNLGPLPYQRSALTN
jgi:hypothetical protein